MTRLSRILIACGLVGALLPAHAEITVDDPWIREAPPGASALAGYLTLENQTDETRRLVGGESPAFGRVELHRTEQDDGVMRMRQAEHFEVSPGERFVLTTGGAHLMLMRPKRRLSAGDTVPVVLHFDDGSTVDATFTVRHGGHDAHGTEHEHHHH